MPGTGLSPGKGPKADICLAYLSYRAGPRQNRLSKGEGDVSEVSSGRSWGQLVQGLVATERTLVLIQGEEQPLEV